MVSSRSAWGVLYALGAFHMEPQHVACGMRVSPENAGQELGVNSTMATVAEPLPSTNWACPPAGFSSISAEKLAAQGGLDSFIAQRWFIQLQQETKYVPKEKNFCVSAAYKRRARPRNPLTLPPWRYDIDVRNYAEMEDGESSGGDICAKIVSSSTGQLKVAPCFLPGFFAGPYWILDYDEQQGYALISGGAPANQGRDEGTCAPGSDVNDAGTWIFTRCPHPSSELLEEVTRIARDRFKLDVSVLNPVSHHPQCRYGLAGEDYEAMVDALAERGCEAGNTAQ